MAWNYTLAVLCLNSRDKEKPQVGEKSGIKKGRNRIFWRRRGVIDGRGVPLEKQEQGGGARLKTGGRCTREIRARWLITARARCTSRYRCENIIQPVGILLNPTKLWSPGLIRYSTDRGPSFRSRSTTCKSLHNVARWRSLFPTNIY